MKNIPSSNFNKNELYNTVKGLKLLAKYFSKSFINGANKSLLLNEGMEFSQYRSYQAGDDIKKIDWKIFGRSDKLYIKESQKYVQTNIHFVLDASNSMNQVENDISKFQFAKAMIATLAYLGDMQKDSLSFSIVNQNILSKKFKTLDSFLHSLAIQKANDKWSSQNLSLNAKQKTLYIYFTDFYEQNNEIEHSVLNNVNKNAESIVFHLISNNELNFNYAKNTSFEDLETGEIINVNAAQIKEHFTKEINNKIAYLKDKFNSKKIHYEKLNLNFNINQQIKTFLKKRSKLVRFVNL